jgi:ABC-type phosphate/phosphonate transport system permease subunit
MQIEIQPTAAILLSIVVPVVISEYISTWVRIKTAKAK